MLKRLVLAASAALVLLKTDAAPPQQKVVINPPGDSFTFTAAAYPLQFVEVDYWTGMFCDGEPFFDSPEELYRNRLLPSLVLGSFTETYPASVIASVTIVGRVVKFGSWNKRSFTVSAGYPCQAGRKMNLVFSALYAYINPDWSTSPRDICFVMSTQGTPSVERIRANCDVRWPSGTRPGWSQGATLFVWGDVYDDGTDVGFWEGDMATYAFNKYAKRLPLHASQGQPSLFSSFCEYQGRVGQKPGWCR